MVKCKYFDCGFCYAPKDVSTSAQPSGACAAPTNCLYLKSQQPVQYETPMTEKERIEGEIKILQKKLALIEKMENYKSPVEEAFKRVYGRYPITDIADTCWDGSIWTNFEQGYIAAQEDYKVGEYQETTQEPKPSMTNCVIEGNPPNGYASWNEWYNELGSKGILHNLNISSIDYEPSPQDPEELMEKLGFVKNSDGNWTGVQPLVETTQERGERIHNEMEETIKIHDGYDVVDYKPTPQTPEQVADGLKKAFREAVKQGVVSSVEKKPQTLYDVIDDWWNDIFTTSDEMEVCIDGLVDRIAEFLPKEHDTNSYKWNECIKMIKSKLR